MFVTGNIFDYYIYELVCLIGSSLVTRLLLQSRTRWQWHHNLQLQTTPTKVPKHKPEVKCKSY